MKRFKLVMAMLAVWVSFLLVGGGVVQAEDGVTEDEILIGSTQDLSGPLAFMGKSFRDGALLYYRYINDKGGIHGRKLKLLVEDDGFQAPRTVQAAKKLITKNKVFCMSMNLGAAGIMAIMPLLKEYKVPMLPAGTGNEAVFVPPRKYVFAMDTSYRLSGIIAVKYIKTAMNIKNPKFACIYQEDVTGTNWRDGLRDGAEKYYGIKEILELSYKRGAIDFSSQIAKCKQAGITHIFVHGNIREPAAMLKEAQRVQFKATYITNAAAGSNKVVELCGDSVDHTNGFYLSTYGGDLLGDKTAGIDLWKELVRKYNPPFAVDANLPAWGFQAAWVLCEVLDRSGKDLTREGFVKAAESMNAFDTGVMTPVTWKPDKRGGGDSVRMWKADAATAAWVRITDWLHE